MGRKRWPSPIIGLMKNYVLGCLAYGAIFSATPVRSGEAPLEKKTYTYKTVGDVRLEADVYATPDGQRRPAVVWIHGGALIVGSRRDVPGRLVELCRREGFVLVSIDYRLAPEVKLPAIIEDVQDAFRWLRTRGPELFAVRTDRLVVAGSSAGGYLTLMTGIRVEPKPTALVAYWGYGDVDGPWYTRPSRHYREHASLVTRDDAYAAVGGKVLTGTEGDVGKRRGRYYLYLRQNGWWTREVTGFDPATERSRLDAYCPVRKITSAFPPVLMMHGTVDTDVPYEESAAMARELARQHVPHELITVPGAGHGLAGGDRRLVADAHKRAEAFIRNSLR